MNIKILVLALFLVLPLSSVLSISQAQDMPIDCHNPLSYGRSFEALLSCRHQSPHYTTYMGEKVRSGFNMMTCEMRDEVREIPALLSYCADFQASFPGRMGDLEGELKTATTFIQSTLIDIYPIPFFLSNIYDQNGIARRFFSDSAWKKAREILVVANQQLFYDKQLSLVTSGAVGEFSGKEHSHYEWRGRINVKLREGEKTLAQKSFPAALSLSFDPEAANDLSPLGVVLLSFDIDINEVQRWVESIVSSSEK
ncbi:hypothetical protein [Thalassospira sp. MCCC 1A01428]|uniref:hypothetical protein n=1 Tax=Thalassospira sp. MCCC 1A01428 TaxID=1470575 RepID=UPI000A1F9E2A|nr:hypothetical protein [Thalassospira sp. MCCC 1A01428]OSQ38668.1 hypothetical protein THS27_21970 [Thalassospira sp. MCCC 1A01428]